MAVFVLFYDDDDDDAQSCGVLLLSMMTLLIEKRVANDTAYEHMGACWKPVHSTRGRTEG